jgi:hypothetical protein
MRAILGTDPKGEWRVVRVCSSASNAISEYARQQMNRDTRGAHYHKLAIVELNTLRTKGERVQLEDVTVIHREK